MSLSLLDRRHLSSRWPMIALLIVPMLLSSGFAQSVNPADPCGWSRAIDSNLAAGMKMEIDTDGGSSIRGYMNAMRAQQALLIVGRTRDFYTELDSVPLGEISKIRYWESTEAHPERAALIGLAGFAAGFFIGYAIERDFSRTGLTLGGLGFIGAFVIGPRIPTHHTLNCQAVTREGTLGSASDRLDSPE